MEGKRISKKLSLSSDWEKVFKKSWVLFFCYFVFLFFFCFFVFCFLFFVFCFLFLPYGIGRPTPMTTLLPNYNHTLFPEKKMLKVVDHQQHNINNNQQQQQQQPTQKSNQEGEFPT